MSKKIGVFVGSLRKDSINRKLARALEKEAPEGLEFEDIPIDQVPHFNQDLESNLPESVVELKQTVESMDGFIFVTPEYNRSFPGVLSNAIDWASRPYGQNSFAGKPAMVAGASIGSISSAMAQQHLRNSLVFVDVYVMAQPEVFIHFTDGLIEDDGTITDDGTAQFLRDAMSTFADWVENFE